MNIADLIYCNDKYHLERTIIENASTMTKKNFECYKELCKNLNKEDSLKILCKFDYLFENE